MPDPLLYELTIPTLRQALRNQAAILRTAEDWCKESGRDVATLSQAKLVPDMFALPFHADFCTFITVQMLVDLKITDTAALPIAPSEKPIGEILARIEDTLLLLDSIPPSRFSEKETEMVQFGSKATSPSQNGLDYVREMILPSFWFHHGMVYSILRVLGVPLEKRMFLSRK